MLIRRRFATNRPLLSFCFSLLLLTFSVFLFISVIRARENGYVHSEDRIAYRKLTQTAYIDLERLITITDIQNYTGCSRWFEIVVTLKRCLMNSVAESTDLWSTIADISSRCGADFVKNLLYSKYLINMDDVKAIIPPQNWDPSAVSLTIGIGNDLSVEHRLKRTFPNTRFYGADPMYHAGKVFASIGQYKQVGISDVGGTINASVMDSNGSYIWQTVPTVTIANLLEQFGLSEIDYLFIDIEGAEYSLLPGLFLKANQTGGTFCQLNVELHGPLEKYGVTMNHFVRIIRSMLAKESPYIPLWIPPPTMHHRLFLVFIPGSKSLQYACHFHPAHAGLIKIKGARAPMSRHSVIMDSTVTATDVLDALLGRWNDLASFMAPALKDKWWKRLVDSYTERAFHNLEHLNEMMLLFDEYKDKLRERYAIGYAIFFLHAAYDPKRNDNAERSAEMLRQFSSETTFDSENYTATLILESGKNCTDAHLTVGVYGEEDIHFLLDFDMAFLGADKAQYDRHSRNIRKEYGHLDDEEYRQQRLKVLKLFMQIPNIYATKELRERFEARARQNIAAEIAELSN